MAERDSLNMLVTASLWHSSSLVSILAQGQVLFQPEANMDSGTYAYRFLELEGSKMVVRFRRVGKDHLEVSRLSSHLYIVQLPVTLGIWNALGSIADCERRQVW